MKSHLACALPLLLACTSIDAQETVDAPKPAIDMGLQVPTPSQNSSDAMKVLEPAGNSTKKKLTAGQIVARIIQDATEPLTIRWAALESLDTINREKWDPEKLKGDQAVILKELASVARYSDSPILQARALRSYVEFCRISIPTDLEDPPKKKPATENASGAATSENVAAANGVASGSATPPSSNPMPTDGLGDKPNTSASPRTPPVKDCGNDKPAATDTQTPPADPKDVTSEVKSPEESIPPAMKDTGLLNYRTKLLEVCTSILKTSNIDEDLRIAAAKVGVSLRRNEQFIEEGKKLEIENAVADVLSDRWTNNRLRTVLMQLVSEFK